MKRRWNVLLYAGFALTLFAAVSYPAFFVRYPVTRDVPWVSYLLFAAALVMLVAGLWRAFHQPALYRGRVSGPILATFSIALVALFAWGAIWQSKKIPASKGAPQVGQKAPDFTLPDTQGNVVTLSSLSGVSTAAGVTGRSSQWVLLIFYRGYW